jgi:hypothetical protein
MEEHTARRQHAHAEDESSTPRLDPCAPPGLVIGGPNWTARFQGRDPSMSFMRYGTRSGILRSLQLASRKRIAPAVDLPPGRPCWRRSPIGEVWTASQASPCDSPVRWDSTTSLAQVADPGSCAAHLRALQSPEACDSVSRPRTRARNARRRSFETVKQREHS